MHVASERVRFTLSVAPGFFPGMTSRDFRGISSIQEVECWGGNINSDVKLMSLQMYKLPESTVLASLNVYTNNCMTFGDYSSCVIHPSDKHRSRIRILVHDLEEGESREYGCSANTLNSLGNSVIRNWKLRIIRVSKWEVLRHSNIYLHQKIFSLSLPPPSLSLSPTPLTV